MKKLTLVLSSIAFMATAVNAEEAKAPAVITKAVPSVANATEAKTKIKADIAKATVANTEEVKASVATASEVKMKIKAKEKSGIVKAKVAISHDMLTYDQAKKKGKEANFITHITATVGDKIVYDASISQFLSKNPLVKFKFAGKKGDELKITYTQLKGEVFFATKVIK
jgi:sulfur-oxidizing protein SoxZ